jgi:hypothetical protein
MIVKQLINLLDSHHDASLHLMLPSGDFVPSHFHVTEAGRVQKNFIDCGGTRRESVSCVLQVWTANDLGHRLPAGRLAKILKLAEPLLGSDELPVEIEYGPDVSSQFIVSNAVITPKGLLLELAGKRTDCLARDKCGVGGCGSEGCCQSA